MALQAVGNQEPVTALWFARETLFSGVGSFVKAFDWSDGSLLAQRQVFRINKVHGMTPYNGDEFIVWGGNSYAVVRLSTDHEIDVVVPEKRCKDWIVDVCSGANERAEPVLYIQTAHNEVLETGASTGVVSKVHRCDERSILYSGKLYIDEKRRLAAAGTVFGGVVVWDLDSDSIIHNFTEHEGSIFDVAWSPDGSRLASCSDDRAIIVWDLAQGCSVAQGWGHISRIWRLRFASNHRLVSAAEDCTARVWELSDSQLTCSSIFTGHKGRNVWSLALSGDACVLATGGGDGRIMLWDLASADEHLVAEELEWDMRSEFGGAIRDCAVNTDGTCAVVSVDGNLWLRARGGAWIAQKSQLARMPTIKAVDDIFVAVSPTGDTVVVGNNGDILAAGSIGNAVLSFQILSKHQIIVQTTPPEAEYRVYNLRDQACVAKLGKPMDQSMMTSAALSADGRLLCLGTRKGDLALYDLGKDEDHLTAFEPNALSAKNAVTAIRFGADPYITATSRSTEYGMFSVPSLAPLLKNRARRRGSVEGFADTVNGLVFWGFQNDAFNTWNASLGFEIASTICGGAHRAWDFKLVDEAETYTLCYVRSPRFVVRTARIQSPRFKYTMIQAGTHGREIRGLESCPAHRQLVAMGSEDTFVSIGWLSADRVETATVIRNGHVSGIQSLHWDPTGRYLFTGGGQGELVMWGVSTAGKSVFAHEVSRMPSAPRTDIYDLRVMDFSILGDLIAVAYSDSSFRVWQFGAEWKLMLREKYRECCLLNIDMVEVEGQVVLLISSTDGHLAIYKLADENAAHAELVLRYKIHQSGVRDSALLVRGPREHRIYTGGDDNAFCCTDVSFDGAQVRATEVFKVEDAHSSSVTAVCVTSDEHEILTTSADQKVKVWSLSGELLDTKFSDISDTGVLMEQGGRVVAGGLGLEFFDLEKGDQ